MIDFFFPKSSALLPTFDTAVTHPCRGYVRVQANHNTTFSWPEFESGEMAAWWRTQSWSRTAAATTLLDEVRAFLLGARWRHGARSRWTAAATTLLEEVCAFLRASMWRWTAAATTATDPAPDFGPGPEAVAEGRVAIQGICFLHLSPRADFGPGPEARGAGCAAGRRVAFYASCSSWRYVADCA